MNFEEITDVWKSYGFDVDRCDFLTKGDEVNSTKPLLGVPKKLNYGNYCGPGTPITVNNDSLDGLDLCCKMHDNFFLDTFSVLFIFPIYFFILMFIFQDTALRHSVKKVIENHPEASTEIKTYAKKINMRGFGFMCQLYRQRYSFIIIFMTIITCIVLTVVTLSIITKIFFKMDKKSRSPQTQ